MLRPVVLATAELATAGLATAGLATASGPRTNRLHSRFPGFAWHAPSPVTVRIQPCSNGTRPAQPPCAPPGIPFLELCSCSGYKFLGANLALAAKHVLCPEAGWAAMVMGGASIGTFMAKTLRQAR